MRPTDATLRRLGRQLRRLRLARGFTQEQAAERARFSSGKYVSEIEAGLRDLPVTTLATVVAALGYTLRDAFENAPRPRRAAAPVPDREPLPAKIEDIAYAINALGSKQRRRVLALMREAMALAKE